MLIRLHGEDRPVPCDIAPGGVRMAGDGVHVDLACPSERLAYGRPMAIMLTGDELRELLMRAPAD